MNSYQRKQIFSQGYACAIACIVCGHGESTEAREALAANGLTSMREMIAMRIDPHDIEILKPLVMEIENRKRRHK